MLAWLWSLLIAEPVPGVVPIQQLTMATPKPTDWTCECGSSMRRYLKTCLRCGRRNPHRKRKKLSQAR